MSKKKDLPAMPFYIGDWKKDPALSCLTREGKMIWMELLFLMWESSERGFLTVNSRPMSDEMIASALNLDNQNSTKWLTLFSDLGLFSRRENDNAIYSRKILRIVELSEKRKNAGLMGGNPNLVNQNPIKRKTKKPAKGFSNAENESENTKPIYTNKSNSINTYLEYYKEELAEIFESNIRLKKPASDWIHYKWKRKEYYTATKWAELMVERAKKTDTEFICSKITEAIAKESTQDYLYDNEIAYYLKSKAAQTGQGKKDKQDNTDSVFSNLINETINDTGKQIGY